MVRTSDFQSENGGSIPPGPILYTHPTIQLIKSLNATTYKPVFIKYSFSFASLISPYAVNNLRTSFSISAGNKALFKQSYMILTWFYYAVSFDFKKKYKINLATLPIKKKIFTLTKAPMAHKTYSKEQYKFQINKFKVSFKAILDEQLTLNSLNSSLFFVLLSKKYLPFLETNILFLKNSLINIPVYDKVYFNYSKYILRY